jgi:hypothetical protein
LRKYRRGLAYHAGNGKTSMIANVIDSEISATACPHLHDSWAPRATAILRI